MAGRFNTRLREVERAQGQKAPIRSKFAEQSGAHGDKAGGADAARHGDGGGAEA